jgi:hypothetical protein
MPSFNCDEDSGFYLYKLIMTDKGGDGWGGITYTIRTDGVDRFTGSLADGLSRGIEYFCVEDGVHKIELSGTASDAEYSEVRVMCFRTQGFYYSRGWFTNIMLRGQRSK